MGKRTNTAAWLENQKRWQIKVQKDNERRTFTSSKPGRTGQREANAKADAWLEDNISGQNTRVDVLLDKYIKSLEGTIAPETIVARKGFIENWIKPNIGNKKIEKLTEGDLQQILDGAARKGIKKRTGLNKKSIRNIRDTIQSFLKYCRKYKYSALTAEFLTVPVFAQNKERRILQPASLKILLTIDNIFNTAKIQNKLQFDNYIYAYRFAVLTGMRPGEILGLKWGDINGDTVNIKRAINSKGRETTGKNCNALRAFGLTALGKEAIDNQRKLSKSESVFEINSQSTFRHRWENYCESNEISYVSLYELRHTFVSLAKNLSDGELRPLVGHSKNMDTYGVYSHKMEGDIANTANKLDDILNSVMHTQK